MMDEPDELETRVLALTGAPLGCAFLQGLGWMGPSAAKATQPVASFYVLIYAVSQVTVWQDEYAEAMPRLLAEGRVCGPSPAPSSPRQPPPGGSRRSPAGISCGSGGARPPTAHERYGQIPRWGLFTSTGFGGISSYAIGASRCAGDLGPLDFPVPRYRLGASAQARVYEVDGPPAWRRLCVAYPRPRREASRAASSFPTSPRRRGTGTRSTSRSAAAGRRAGAARRAGGTDGVPGRRLRADGLAALGFRRGGAAAGFGGAPTAAVALSRGWLSAPVCRLVGADLVAVDPR